MIQITTRNYVKAVDFNFVKVNNKCLLTTNQICTCILVVKKIL